MTRVAFRQCDVERAIRALKAEGLTVTGVEHDPVTGMVRVLTGPVASPQMSATEKWKAQIDAKRASGGR